MSCSECAEWQVFTLLLTFDLQVDVVLLAAQVVGGNAGVFSAVLRLGHMDLQCAVGVKHVWIPSQYTILPVLGPERQI